MTDTTIPFARLEHGIPTVSSGVARDLLFPFPRPGQKVKRTDTGSIEQWTGETWFIDIGVPQGRRQTKNVNDYIAHRDQPNPKDYGTAVGTGSDDTQAFIDWNADFAAGVGGARTYIPAGTFNLSRKISFAKFGHHFDTAGQDATIINFSPDASAYDIGVGSVKCASNVGKFLYRYQFGYLGNDERIVVGGYHYRVNSIVDGGGETVAGVTLTRVGNNVTFHFTGGVTSMAGWIENGTNVSVYNGGSGGGYVVSNFNGSNTCTLTKTGQTGSAADATFADGATINANYFVATLTPLNGGPTTFGASPFTIPHVAAFEWKLPNVTPWLGATSLIGYVRVRGFTFVSSDATNQKIALDFWDQSNCSVDELRVANVTGNGAVGGIGGDTLTPSVGIRTIGREHFNARKCTLKTDQPILFRSLAFAPDTSIDAYRVEKCDLLSMVASNHGIRIQANNGGKCFSVIGGSCEGGTGWVIHEGGGNYNYSPSIERLSYEQVADPTGYVIDWQAPSYAMNISDVAFGGIINTDSAGGVRVRGVKGLTIKSSFFVGGWDGSPVAVPGTGTVAATAGATVFQLPQPQMVVNSQVRVAGVTYTVTAVADNQHATLSGAPTFTASAFTRDPLRDALNVDVTCDDINLEDYRTQTGATSNISVTFESMQQEPRIDSATPFASHSFWHRIGAAGDGRLRVEQGMPVEKLPGTLKYGEALILAFSLSGGTKSAFVTASAHADAVAYVVSSLTSVGTTATAAIPAGHGLLPGNVARISIAGATGPNAATWNNGGVYWLMTYASPTTLTFTTGGALAASGPCTGSITEFKAGGLWVWSTSGLLRLAANGPILDDNTLVDWNVAWQYGVGGHNLQMTNAYHYPPVTFLLTALSTTNG
jgi:hypothetical protein